MADFLMPSLGADMEAGTLVAWRKRPGEPVARGEILAEVETDKGVIEVECFMAGVLAEQLVQPGTKVPVGTKLARIAERPQAAVVGPATGAPEPRASSVSEPSAAVRAAPEPSARRVPEPSAGPSATSGPGAFAGQAARATPAARRRMRERGATLDWGSGREGVITRSDVDALSSRERAAHAPAVAPTVLATPSLAGAGEARAGTQERNDAEAPRPWVSPLAKRLAGELGVALGDLRGSGAAGAVIADDVRARAQALAGERRPAAAFDEGRMRAAIGQAMARSKREIPHFYLSHTVDLYEPLAWLRAENDRRGIEERVLAGVLFVRAVALAAAKFPELNGYFTGQGPEPQRDVHVGVAVALRGGGLIAPAIMHADQLSLSELNRAFKDLVARARRGQLRSSEMASATITVTSLGERGVEAVFPVIMPPQVAMVGFGAILERPLVVDGAVVARPSVTVTLAADHRVSDGHRASLFLTAIQTSLKETPS